jgi:uncharacterized protein (UPF0254 family)
MIMDYKTLAINISSFGISLTNIDMVLKIILLSVTIGYTVQKWYLMNKNKKSKKQMATKISEDTNVQLDLKTIAMIVGGAISLASMWFTLQGDIQDLNNKIDNFSSDEFVQKMEFQLKDELVRSTIITIEKSTDGLKEDIIDNKDRINKLEDKVYRR